MSNVGGPATGGTSVVYVTEIANIGAPSTDGGGIVYLTETVSVAPPPSVPTGAAVGFAYCEW